MARWTESDLKAHRGNRIDQAQKRRAAKPRETANGITRNIIRLLNMKPGCVAYRINNVGVWDAAKGIHRSGNTEKGLPDIMAVINGRFAGIEVKAGRDKMSQEQCMRKFEIEKAGGLFFEARSTDDFIEWIDKIIEQ